MRNLYEKECGGAVRSESKYPISPWRLCAAMQRRAALGRCHNSDLTENGGNMMKRWIAGALILVMLLSCIIGCGKTEVTKTTTQVEATNPVITAEGDETEVTIPAQTEQPSLQVEANFDRDFNVLCWGKTSDKYTNYLDIHAETINGSILNDAVYNRNILLEEKFGIRIFAQESGKVATVETAVNAGDNTYSAVMFGMVDAMSLAQRGMLLDTENMVDIHMDMPWWNSELQDSLTVAGRSFVLMGDMNMQQWTQNALVYFNKRIAAENQIEDLYTLVRDKKWTMDKLAEYSAQIYSDLNGDSIADEMDQYGSVFSNFAVPCLLYGAGITFVSRDANGDLEFGSQEMLYDAYEKVLEYCLDPTTLYTDLPQYTSRRADISWDSFIGGKSLFLIEKFDIFTKLQQMDDMYGLLPIPLLDETQAEYHTWTHNSHGATTVVPVSAVDDLEMISIILDDMAYYSMKEVRPAYYENVLQRKLSQDQESSDIVPIIVDGVTYDIGCVVLTMDAAMRTAVDDGRSSVVALMQAYQKQMQKKLDNLTEVFEKLE